MNVLDYKYETYKNEKNVKVVDWHDKNVITVKQLSGSSVAQELCAHKIKMFSVQHLIFFNVSHSLTRCVCA